MGTAPLPQATPSTYQWGDLFDFLRRRGANSASWSAQDQLMVIRKVSAFIYVQHLWPFTMATTSLGQIQCVNGQQDYAQPDDMYRLSRAWFYVPTQTFPDSNSYGPYDDPSYLAQLTTDLSVAYVTAQANGGGTPAGITWPPAGSLDVVKRLPQNLLFRNYIGIRAVTQQPNQNLIRLDSATMVSGSQPYSLELEYQLQRPNVNTTTELCWFPDEYVSMAEEGLLYELYKYTNDARAGSASMSSTGQVVYSGQMATWMAAIQSVAGADREGSVNSITPEQGLGSEYSGRGLWI